MTDIKLIESLARENVRLAAENAELRATLNTERENRGDNGDPMLIDRLRAELESARPLLEAAVRYRKSGTGFINMVTLGNAANDYVAKLDAKKGG